ncbi:MAG: hypothetical protein KME43_22330 [Myxacorys chilensis ATA2-1-KO14]|jgi:hypothetical protein|nr:hypothetical protein [Myxacorys chilensis ATA2-1-KO14]
MKRLKIWQSLIRKVLLLSLVLSGFLGIQLLLPQIAKADSGNTWAEKMVQAGESLGSSAIKTSGTVAGAALNASLSAGSTALQTGTGIAQTAVQVGGVVGGAAVGASKVAVGTAVHVGGTVGTVALQAGKAATGAAIQVGGVVGDTTLQVGKVAVGKAIQVGGVVGSATVQVGQITAKETYQLMGQAAEGAKHASELIAQGISQSFNSQVLPLLDVVIDELDTVQIEARTHQWQQMHPDQMSGQLAKHFIWNHARKSLLPSDWVTTVRTQAELVYEIAALYGLDLNDPARKAEIISLATVNLSSGPTIKAGVGLLKYPISQVPFAGDAVDIGSDSMLRFAMVHILGHAACRYYATKVGVPVPDVITASSQAERESLASS